MTTEDKLRQYILTKYRSLREFAQEIQMPYSTINTIMNKGIAGSSVNKIITICQALQISTDDLAEGRIVPVNQNTTKTKVEDLIADLKHKLMNTKNLTIDDMPATEEDLQAVINALEISLEIGKRNIKTKG